MTSRNTFPLSLEIRPASETDAQRLPELLGNCRTPDIDFDFRVDRLSGHALIYAVSEADLEVILERLMQALSARPHIHAPEVCYREVLKREAEIEYRHKRTRAGADEFAVVQFRLLRADPDLPLSFASTCPANVASRDLFDAVAQGVASVRESGPIVGKPVYGVQATLVGVKAMEGISAPLHFEIAARAAVRLGLSKSLELHEPIMSLEINAPTANTSAVVIDLMSRRGTVVRQRRNDLHSVVEAEVPVSNTFGYICTLRSMTKGVGTYTQKFSHYAPVPTGSGPDDPDDFAPAMALRP